MDKTRFYDELTKSRKGMAKNTVYLTDDEYNDTAEHVIELKHGNKKKKAPRDV